MSTALILALLAVPAATNPKPADKDEITCTQVTIPNSRFTRKECISKSNAARRTRNAEAAWQGLQNATGPTPQEGL